MSLSVEQLRLGLDALATIEPAFARGIEAIGYPPPRIRDRGYQTLLRTIVGQQVSVTAANSIWAKLERLVGAGLVPEAVAASPDELLREAGLSRQKAAYAKSLAEHVVLGTIDFANLPADDEEAIAQMTAIKAAEALGNRVLPSLRPTEDCPKETREVAAAPLVTAISIQFSARYPSIWTG